MAQSWLCPNFVRTKYCLCYETPVAHPLKFQSETADSEVVPEKYFSHFETSGMGGDLVAPEQKKIALILSLLLLGVGGLYTNCGQVLDMKRAHIPSATSVGNPMKEEYAREFMADVCAKLSLCHGKFSTKQCESSLALVAGVGEVLGLPPNISSTLSEMMSLEEVRYIKANRAYEQACVAAIDSLNCSSAAIQNSYDSQSSTPFQGVVQLISGQSSSCGQAFTCNGICSGLPSPLPSPVPSATASMPPAPSPGASGTAGYCVYWDEIATVPGQSYSCPSHGAQALTTFVRADFNAIFIFDTYVDSACQTRASFGVSFFSSSANSAGVVPDQGTIRVLGYSGTYNLTSTYPCTQIPNATQPLFIKKDTSTPQWSGSQCVWYSNEAVCPP